jgi:hypothetical protein
MSRVSAKRMLVNAAFVGEWQFSISYRMLRDMQSPQANHLELLIIATMHSGHFNSTALLVT